MAEITKEEQEKGIVSFLFMFSLLLKQTNLLQGQFAHDMKSKHQNFFAAGQRLYKKFKEMVEQDKETVGEFEENKELYFECLSKLEMTRDVKGLLKAMDEFNIEALKRNPKLKYTDPINKPKVVGKIDIEPKKKRK